MSDLVLTIGVVLFWVILPVSLCVRLWVCFEASASYKLVNTLMVLTPFLGVLFYFAAVSSLDRKPKSRDL